MNYFRPFHEHYREILSRAYYSNCQELNQRTGAAIRVIKGGYYFALNLEWAIMPLPVYRRIYIKSAAAETAWQILGDRSTKFISKYTKMWKKFEEGGEIKAAYGYRWQTHFGRNQLDRAIDVLRDDPSDRQVIIMAWDPGSDALGDEQKANVPCPIFFQLYILEQQLCMSVYLRSSDVFVGLPYDVLNYALLLKAIQEEIDNPHLKLGTLQFTLAHAHLYESHFKAAKHIIMDKALTLIDACLLPDGWPVSRISTNPDAYVSFIDRRTKVVAQTFFDPKPEIIV